MPPMALSLTTQWTLVASGLVAHADHVLAGEECERLMALVDEEIDGDAYAEWMSAISDPARLSTLLAGLAVPPAPSHRQILEDAWLMAVVDGERCEAEIEALRRIAARLQVETAQLDAWREAWSTAQHARAEATFAALVHVLGDDAPRAVDEGIVEGFVHELPTTHEHRAQLLAAGLVAPAPAELQRRLRPLTRPQRRDLARRLMSGARTEEARGRWRALASELGLTDEELDRLADA
jgi:hypothetical protein